MFVKINVIVKLLQIASGIQKEHEAASFSLIASFLRIAGIKRWNIRLNTLAFEGLKQNFTDHVTKNSGAFQNVRYVIEICFVLLFVLLVR
jgi:hypothetical protein